MTSEAGPTEASLIGEFIDRMRQQLTAPGAAFEVAPEDVRGSRLDVFRHRARSARELLETSAGFGERTFLIDGDLRLDFSTHLAKVDAFACHLQREVGVAPGDRVAIYSANRWEWVVAYWAIISVGAIPAAFNGWWTRDEALDAAALAGPVLILGDEPRLGRLAASDHCAPLFGLADLGVAASVFEGEHPIVPSVDEDAPAELIFTSGTTGRAKAVAVPHRSLVGFVQMNLFSEAVGRLAGGGALPMHGDALPLSDEIVLVTSPLFHVSMLHGVVAQAVGNGSAFVLLPGRFDPVWVLATIEEERVTRWLALGSAGPRLAASDAVGTYDTGTVRQLGVGGAPVSPAVQDALRSAFPSAKESIGMGYTSTEAGAVIAGIGGPEYRAHPTSTGRLNVTTELELRHPSGVAVGEGDYGEVHIRSPYMMLGYWKDPAASSAVLKSDGWLAMGDIARIEDGLLYIDSRARDMILVSGENVSPTEIEFRLDAHPGVIEAAVIAVDDDVTGDAACAIVSVDPGTAVTAEQLESWCRESLAGYKVPTHWYLLDEALPRTASGKLLKQALRVRIDSGELVHTMCSTQRPVQRPRARAARVSGSQSAERGADA
jgi:long-chain acyl-CoA synthetase